MAAQDKSLPYRPCVGICLLNKSGQVLVGERIDTPDAWQMPQGGIDKGEDPQSAAFRELQEEIGTANAEVMARTREWLFYDLPDHLYGKVWKGRYGGQKQIWYAMRFLGDDGEINLETEHAEFSKWKWVDLEETPKLIVPFKVQIYREVVNQFRYIAHSV